MKKITLLIICNLFLISGFAQWQPVNNGLYGEFGTFYKSLAIDPITNYVFAGTNGSGVFLSSDNGTNWTAVNSGLSGDALIINTLSISGSNIFAGTQGGVYLSTNNGGSWTVKNNGLSDMFLNVQSITISGSNIFVGTQGGVFLSTNNGSSWTAKNSGLYGQGLDVKSIVITGSNVFAGTSGGGVFLSTNNGSTWTAVNNGLSGDALYVSSLAISGSNIFAGTNAGVFLSTNNGSSWTAVNSGLIDTDINSLAIIGSNIFAGTGAGGMWKRSLSDFGVVTGIQETEDKILKINLFPNPAKDNLVIDLSEYSNTQDYSLKIINMLGTTVFETKLTQSHYEINTSNWSGKGVYVLQVYDSNKITKAVKKIILQ